MRRETADLVQADARLASKLEALASWIEKVERANEERRLAAVEIANKQADTLAGELRVMRAEIEALLGDVR